MKLDLHGYTTHNAWHAFNSAVSDAYYMKRKTIVVITGQGAIMREFNVWASNHPHVRSWTNAPYNPGSFTVSIKKG